MLGCSDYLSSSMFRRYIGLGVQCGTVSDSPLSTSNTIVGLHSHSDGPLYGVCVCGQCGRARRREAAETAGSLCACAIPAFPDVRRKSAHARSTRVRALVVVQCAEHEKTMKKHPYSCRAPCNWVLLCRLQCVAGAAMRLRVVCAHVI